MLTGEPPEKKESFSLEEGTAVFPVKRSTMTPEWIS
jgi:hypothetical protein